MPNTRPGLLRKALGHLPIYASAAWLPCEVCLEEFPFTQEERRFFVAKGFRLQPRRCKACRLKRRATLKGEVLYPAVCSNCTRPIKVNFQPDPTKNIYCADCLVSLRLTQSATETAKE